jgi:DNA polymerase-1
MMAVWAHAGLFCTACKRTTTYGVDWLQHVAADGRVYAGWRQIGADSGRMACRDPNLQNLPHDPAYRRCFVAPPGRVLVKADFSQIELRIAAKVSADRSMLDDFRRGQDLHTLTAQRVLGISEVTTIGTRGSRQSWCQRLKAACWRCSTLFFGKAHTPSRWWCGAECISE